MKLRNFLALMSVAFLATGFTSCSDDDDDETGNGSIIVTPIPADSIISGNYKGNMSFQVKGPASVSENEFVEIKAQENKKFTITIPEVKNSEASNMRIPNLTLTDVDIIVCGENKYCFGIDAAEITIDQTKYTITDFLGTVENDSLNLSLNVKPGAMPMFIKMEFKGGKFTKSIIDLTHDFYGVNGMTVKGETTNDSTCVTRLIKQENGNYTLVLPESTDAAATPEAKMSVPTITLKDLVLTEGENQIFTTSFDKMTVQVSPEKKAEITKFNLTVDNNKKSLTLSYGVQYGRMPHVIEDNFKTLFKNDFLVGNFLGDNIMIVGKNTMPDSCVTATLRLQEDGNYTLVLPEAKNVKTAKGGMDMPTVEINNIVINESTNYYSFNIEETSVVASGMKISIKNMKGQVHGNKMSLSYVFSPGDMPMPIQSNFEGSKVAE